MTTWDSRNEFKHASKSEEREQDPNGTSRNHSLTQTGYTRERSKTRHSYSSEDKNEIQIKKYERWLLINYPTNNLGIFSEEKEDRISTGFKFFFF
jgi:hypothetical protein